MRRRLGEQAGWLKQHTGLLGNGQFPHHHHRVNYKAVKMEYCEECVSHREMTKREKGSWEGLKGGSKKGGRKEKRGKERRGKRDEGGAGIERQEGRRKTGRRERKRGERDWREGRGEGLRGKKQEGGKERREGIKRWQRSKERDWGEREGRKERSECKGRHLKKRLSKTNF